MTEETLIRIRQLFVGLEATLKYLGRSAADVSHKLAIEQNKYKEQHVTRS